MRPRVTWFAIVRATGEWSASVQALAVFFAGAAGFHVGGGPAVAGASSGSRRWPRIS
jgi:hypothetical protein